MRSPTPKYSYHKWRNDHGGALVEFAIVLPLLLMIAGGIIEFGVMFYNKQVITNACREGARAGIVFQRDGDGNKIVVTESDVQQTVLDYLIDPDTGKYKLIIFSGSPSIATSALDAATLSQPVQNLSYPEDLNVTVTFTHNFLLSSLLNFFGGNFGPTLDISAATIMRME